MGTVLGSGLLAVLPAHAQELPVNGDVVSGGAATWSVNGGAPGGGTINPVGAPADTGTLDINLSGPTTVINWRSFSVKGGDGNPKNVVNFNGAAGGVVLNRVIGDSGTIMASQIVNGDLNAPGLSLWLLNPAGILVGADGAISAGQFVGSNLDIACASLDCDDGGNPGPNDDPALTSFGPGVGRITLSARAGYEGSGVEVQRGGTIITDNGIGLIGGSVRVGVTGNAASPAMLDAGTGGNLALVAGREITIERPGSPIGVTITRGSPVTTTLIETGGSIKGARVLVAAVRAGDADAALLNLGGTITATNASVNEYGVVILGGSDSAGADFIDLAGGETSGQGKISGAATLAVGSNSGIRIEGNGDIEIERAASLVAGALPQTPDATARLLVRAAQGMVSLDAGSGAAGAITAGGDIDIQAQRIQASSRGLRSEAGSVLLTATAGTIALDGADAANNVAITASGTVRVTGNVTAGRTIATGAYTIDAAGAELGNDGDAEEQKAAGGVRVTTTSGGIVAGTGLTLRANSDLAGGERLELSAAGGDITAMPTASFYAGFTNTASFDPLSDILLHAPGQMIGFEGVGTPGSVSAGRHVLIGRVDPLTMAIEAGSILASNRSFYAAAGSVLLGASAGDINILAADAANDVAIKASGTARVTGDVTAGRTIATGAYTIDAAVAELGNDADAEEQKAAGGVRVTTTAGSILAGAGLTLRANSDLAGGERLELSAAGGGITVMPTASLYAGFTSTSLFDPGSDILLHAPGQTIGFEGAGTPGAVSAGRHVLIGRTDPLTMAIEAGSILASNRSFYAAAGSVLLGASAGDINILAADAANDVAIKASGTVRVTGDVTAGRTIATGAYTIDAAAAELGNDGDGEVQKAAGRSSCGRPARSGAARG